MMTDKQKKLAEDVEIVLIESQASLFDILAVLEWLRAHCVIKLADHIKGNQVKKKKGRIWFPGGN